MGMKITLPCDVRYFVARDGTAKDAPKQLSRTEKVMPAGTVIRLQGSIQRVIYDHRLQDAIAFRFNGGTYYFLVHEIRIANLVEQIRTPRHLRVVK